MSPDDFGVVDEASIEIVLSALEPVLISLTDEAVVIAMDAPAAVAVQPVETVVQTIELGIQGPPGRPANLAEFSFSFGDATPVPLGNFSGVVIAVSIVILEAFDGVEAQLAVTAPGKTLLAATDNLPAEPGRYESNPSVRLGGATPLQLEITPGSGASRGSGIVYLEITQ